MVNRMIRWMRNLPEGAKVFLMFLTFMLVLALIVAG